MWLQLETVADDGGAHGCRHHDRKGPRPRTAQGPADGKAEHSHIVVDEGSRLHIVISLTVPATMSTGPQGNNNRQGRAMGNGKQVDITMANAPGIKEALGKTKYGLSIGIADPY